MKVGSAPGDISIRSVPSLNSTARHIPPVVVEEVDEATVQPAQSTVNSNSRNMPSVKSTAFKTSRRTKGHWCDICNVPLTGPKHMKIHVKGRKHRNRLDSLRSSAYDCVTCSKIFKDRKDWAKHRESKKHQKLVYNNKFARGI